MSRALLILTILAAMVFAVHFYRIYSLLEEAFAGARLGVTSKATVLKVVGPPDKVTSGDTFYDGRPQSPLHPDCEEIHWFELPVSVRVVSFCFDSNDTLVHKYNWVSW